MDTTVLVYAVGGEHPLKQPCLDLIRARTDSLTTTAGVLQEFVHVRSRRRPRSDAVELASAYLKLFSPLLDVPEPAVHEALDLLERHEDLGAFDAVLAATARLAGCTALVTADRAFEAVDGLTVVYPDTAGVGALLV
ncbi:type II toxin-antitoxin system VapC family toxin [Actinokineospora sp.]|uniref:type II toxin-antitoxin system VapC family toxin n=1 Tax=Actinokineospora sp. TaxID=1872133 RepID=UPI00403775BA